jgi:site-specific recombinase XerD
MSDETHLTDWLPVSASDSRENDWSNPPSIVAAAGNNARFAYEEFLSGLSSPHTARAYRHAIHRFMRHVEGRGLSLHSITPGIVSSYFANLSRPVDSGEDAAEPLAIPSRKLHLAALRHFFDKAVERHAIILNPAAAVRGPRYSVTEGKTPAIEPRDARRIIEEIETTPRGLRDRAIIATLISTAARVGAVAGLRREDFYTDGRQFYLRLAEKGGKQRTIPARHDLHLIIEDYLAVAPFPANGPLFVSGPGQNGRLSMRPLSSNDILRMVKRRFRAAGLSAPHLCCHSFRAGSATNLLEQGVDAAEVQVLLGHSDPRTTRLYDRRQLSVSRNIVERIAF